jgi:hypothetical protein
MSEHVKQWAENLRTFLDSPEGKLAIAEFGEKMKREEAHEARWVEKFKVWAEPDMDAAIKKLIDKYYSDEYRDREYDKCKCMPREPLLWVALEYAVLNCPECTDERYLNCFTGGAWHIGSYVIQVMHGQGSVIKIEEFNQEI